jgi:hypothetical protein
MAFSVQRHYLFFVSTLVVVFSIFQTLNASPVVVEDGVYSRVTVQIEAQPQPENCVEFLNQLEVGNLKMKKKNFFVWQHMAPYFFITWV